MKESLIDSRQRRESIRFLYSERELFPEEQAQVDRGLVSIIEECLMMSFFWKGFSDIERRERHEDICLEECNEELEEPEWKGQDTEGSRMEKRNLFSDIDRHRDEDHPDEDIEKKSHREGSDTDELSCEVEPSDKDTDYLLSGRVSMIVEEVMLQLMHQPLESESRELCEHDDGEREDESRRQVRVDRSQIRTEPLIARREHEEIHHESEDIPEKNHDHESAEEPDISMCRIHVSEKPSDIGDESCDDIESECLQSWESITAYREVKYSNNHKKHDHKYPCRKNRIRDMDTSDIPVSDIRSMRSRDMRTDMF